MGTPRAYEHPFGFSLSATTKRRMSRPRQATGTGSYLLIIVICREDTPEKYRTLTGLRTPVSCRISHTDPQALKSRPV